VNHQLLYAFGNPDSLKLGENSDGVAPLSSQLYPVAQKQSDDQFGFNSSHTGILEDTDLIDHVIDRIERVKSFFPDEQLEVYISGGYDVELSDEYSPVMKYIIRSVGRYFMAVSQGKFDPLFPAQEHFIRAVRGECPPDNYIEEEWIMFLREYPELRTE